jgi:hypothetical protein
MVDNIIPPFQYFHDNLGDPLDNGYIYIGNSGQNPEAYPKQAYWDAALSIPAAQPIRTVAGRPARNGSPSNVYVSGDYSITTRDAGQNLVASSLTVGLRLDSIIDGSSEVSPAPFDSVADLLASTEAARGAGSIWQGGGYRYEEADPSATDQHLTTAGGVKLYVLPVSASDYAAAAFNVKGDGSTDDASAIQNAWDGLLERGGGRLFFGVGTFIIGSSIDLVSEASGTFNQGPAFIGAGSGWTIFDNRVSGAPMLDISAGGTPGTNFLKGGMISGIKIISTTGTSQTGIQLSTAYQFPLEDVHVDGLTGTGLRIVCTLGDNDGSNMVSMTRCRFENCTEWNIDAKGDGGFNETSFILMNQCFVQAGGTDEYKTVTAVTQANPGVVTAASHGFSNGDVVTFIGVGGMVELNGNKYTVANATTNTFELSATDTTAFTAYTSGGEVGPHIPTSGGMRWKGQMLTTEQCAFVLNENVGLFIPGEAGLGQGFFPRDTTFEHNKKRGLFTTGVKAVKGRNLQFYNNDGAVALTGFEADGSTFAVANIDIDGVVVRATSGNDTYTAFKVSGANVDYGSVGVKNVNYDDFGYSGQVKQSGFQNDPVAVVQKTGAQNVGNAISAMVFDSEVTDLQARYDTSNGRWAINYETYAQFTGQITITGLTAGDEVVIELYEVESTNTLATTTLAAAGLTDESFRFDFIAPVGSGALTRNYQIRAMQDNAGGSLALNVSDAQNNTLHVRRASYGVI